ncbi:beta-ketoacyl-[acyl-carrier-protein] synthase family protein [Auraticoccus monumenti]|uniref:3-oxoacyl-[acyl-carrier-protein] synthase II n=1 Tax=Auraticoccus monumenti TaxID=675864 RepID=A0A1G7E8G8_9ACTN|nr:beta-ketoacyl-[acyl-carrier-protein] synthase family protein [Auraticoccus monumenti]SDE59963.1 3-oxoacyl-[acyl-carrier-protein] synthase II [Auraticoccus monumenti]
MTSRTVQGRTVVVTGLGATTPLGGDVASTWSAMLAGRSGTRELTHEWAEPLPSRVAAEVAVDPLTVLERVEARRMDRSTQLATVAALEAWSDAGFSVRDESLDPDRLAVSIATGIGGMQTLLQTWDTQKEKGHRRVSPFAIPMLMGNASAGSVGLRLGARAGVHTPVAACASSNESIAQGLDMIRYGRADIVLAGGTEAVVHPLPMACFGQMQALSRRNHDAEHASRPWDVDRDGFVLAEGAAMLVLETLEHAQARGAHIYGTLVGAGYSNDAHDMVQPDPAGTGQTNAVKRGLADADLAPRDVVHVNAHATSTPQGDLTEALSIRQALGDAVDGAVVTGTKSMTGHLLGGAGALESLATLLALHHRVVPATINIDTIEPDLGIDVATTNRELPAGDLAAVNNSFGFGGANVAVLLTNQNSSAPRGQNSSAPLEAAGQTGDAS